MFYPFYPNIGTLFKCATDGLRSETILPKPIDYCGNIWMQSLSTGVLGLGIIALMVAAAQFFRYCQEEDEERVESTRNEAKATSNSLLRLDMGGL